MASLRTVLCPTSSNVRRLEKAIPPCRSVRSTIRGGPPDRGLSTIHLAPRRRADARERQGGRRLRRGTGATFHERESDADVDVEVEAEVEVQAVEDDARLAGVVPCVPFLMMRQVSSTRARYKRFALVEGGASDKGDPQAGLGSGTVTVFRRLRGCTPGAWRADSAPGRAASRP